MMRLALFLAVFALPASAQDLSFSSDGTEACLEGHVSKRDCIGTSANLCMDTPDGSTTVGMGYCLSQELRYWDDRLNTAYRTLISLERGLDEGSGDLGGNIPERASALRDMQRAWIGYRDAACVYEYAQWGGGTGGGPANAACLMQLTAEQALSLEGRLEDHNR